MYISFLEGTVFEMGWKTHHTPVITEVGVFQAWFAARNSRSIYLRHFANGGGGHSGVKAVLLQSYCKSLVLNPMIWQVFEIRF